MLRQAWEGVPGIAPAWHGRHAGSPGLRFTIPEDEGALAGAIAQADVILCLAGVVPGRGTLEHNSRIAEAVLTAARPGQPVFLTSSAAVYGPAEAPRSEVDRPDPATAYGRAKLEMERVAAASDRRVTCLRIGNVAGADQLLGGGVVRPRRLDRFDDGATPVRSYIGPATLARVLLDLARVAASGTALPSVLNVAAPGQVAMADLLEADGQPWVPVAAPPTALRALLLDVSRLSALVPLEPEEGSPAELVRQFRAYRAGLSP